MSNAYAGGGDMQQTIVQKLDHDDDIFHDITHSLADYVGGFGVLLVILIVIFWKRIKGFFK